VTPPQADPVTRPPEQVPFCDLRAGFRQRAGLVEEALLRVARSGRYVLGPELDAFERDFAALCGGGEIAGVGSGTDALALIFRAAGIGRGEDVLVPAYTAAATWMAVAAAGATPVGVDVVPATGLIDPAAARAAVGPGTSALVAVHLFGRLAPMAELRRLSARHGLLLVEDAAHAAGVAEAGARAGTLGDAAAFSFYPTKPLAGLGDGGAVATGDRELAATVRRLRSYGWSEWKGRAPTPGFNSRLDEIHAAVLRAQLPGLPLIHERLRALAARYRGSLAGVSGLTLPSTPPEGEVPWHQFVVTHAARDRLAGELARRGIGTAIHYDPIPPSLEAFAPAPAFPAAQALAAQALSLPFDPWLTDAQTSAVGAAVAAAIGNRDRSVT
jgi:dTDP-3-amino-3,6-dideoxy-alpha-D-glucopyranose transaminase